MSYDKKIGFYSGTASDPSVFLGRMGIEPIAHDLKTLLPKESKEPEPKIWLPRASSFLQIRDHISNSSNAFIIPGQVWSGKFPLVSILTDTRKNGFPTAKLDQSNYSLRLRYEVDPNTGQEMQYDFNEKSGMAVSQKIGGLQDRDEREHDFSTNTSFEEGYTQFLQKYRINQDPAMCDGVPYSEHHVYGGYIAARTEYGFAVKHPDHDVVFVFEACEDVYDTYQYDMCQATQTDICEFEFEPKQIWGRLPGFAASSPENFRAFLYSSMIQIRDHIAMSTPGALINLKSKAENTKEQLANWLPSGSITETGLSEYYKGRVPTGYSDHLSPLQTSLMMGHTIEKTLKEARGRITHRCSEMHRDKLQFAGDYDVPGIIKINKGSCIIPMNDNMTDRRAALIVNGP